MYKFEDTDFDDLWLETQKFWKIETDAPKAYMKKWAVKLGTNFRSRLATKYIYNPKPNGQKAWEKYPFIEREHWEEFVKQRTSKEFKAKRAKAKASSAKRKHVLRLGRGIQNPRSKLYLMDYAKINKEAKMYELDDDTFQKGGALIYTQCELLINVGDSLVKVAYGVAWPSTGAVLHCIPIMEGCVKVSVDDIVDIHMNLDLYNSRWDAPLHLYFFTPKDVSQTSCKSNPIFGVVNVIFKGLA
ncbi:hypothetical protein L1987_61945 [Smallanthus sonchifolius]|uniref:Uncharacterized protein n=1 Tax=Smallanthus sonchifolius TaxID=185202 RepID=A0ACB9C958_9ASTR|nr:hypothetical protein L1987_61945 [Smallanthus sonchifolius]